MKNLDTTREKTFEYFKDELARSRGFESYFVFAFQSKTSTEYLVNFITEAHALFLESERKRERNKTIDEIKTILYDRVGEPDWYSIEKIECLKIDVPAKKAK